MDCGDRAPGLRFIPNRTTTTLTPQCELTQHNFFSSMLRSQLFGDAWKSPRLKYSAKIPGKEKENLPRMLIEPVFPTFTPELPRIIPKFPYKVLDAPRLLDDFYVNLLDWSCKNYLAVALTSEVYLWNADTSEVTKLASYTRTHVTSLAWNRTGDLLAVGLNTGRIQVFDVGKIQVVRDLGGHVGRVGVLAWGPGVLSSGGKDKETATPLLAHKQEVCGLKWSPDDQQLASGSNDNRVKIWSLNNQMPVTRLNKHTAAVKAVAWSPHQHGLLATGGGTADRSICLWNTLTGTVLSHTVTKGQVSGLVFSRTTSELVSIHGYSLNQAVIWKSPCMTYVGALTGHSSRVLYVSLSADGSSLVTGAGDETLRFWYVFPRQESQVSACELDVSFGELR